jgi:hypothetical protein
LFAEADMLYFTYGGINVMKQESVFRNVTFFLAKGAGVISAIICVLLIAQEYNSARFKLDIHNREVQGWEACRQTNPSYFRVNKEAVSCSQKKFDEARDNFWVKLPKAQLVGLSILGGLGSATGAYLATWAVLWFGGLGIHRFIRTVYANQVRESSPIVGVKLADHKPSRRGVNGSEKGRLAHVPKRNERDKRLTKTTRQFENLHEQIRQLQHEITKCEQTEVRIEQRFAKLMAFNEQSQHEVAEHKRVEEHREQQTDEVSVANKPFQRSTEWPRGNYKCDDSHHVNGKVKQKLCSKCKQQKAESDFHKDRSCKDGLARWCKECKAKAARECRRKRQLGV